MLLFGGWCRCWNARPSWIWRLILYESCKEEMKEFVWCRNRGEIHILVQSEPNRPEAQLEFEILSFRWSDSSPRFLPLHLNRSYDFPDSRVGPSSRSVDHSFLVKLISSFHYLNIRRWSTFEANHESLGGTTLPLVEIVLANVDYRTLFCMIYIIENLNSGKQRKFDFAPITNPFCP